MRALPLSLYSKLFMAKHKEKGLRAFLFRGHRDISRPSPLLLCKAVQSLLCLNPSLKITKNGGEPNYPPQTTSLPLDGPV